MCRDRLVLLLIFCGRLVSGYVFSDDQWNAFDAYGVKLAINDLVVAQARNRDSQFIVQFGPFDQFPLLSPCYVEYVGNKSGDNNFIYSIALSKYHLEDALIVFIGENDDHSTSPYPFVGHLRLNASCHSSYHIHFFDSYQHDEFYVLGVDPTAEVAYGFSTLFAFSYHLQTFNITYLQQWPITSFTPRAMDVSISHTAIIAGLLKHNQYSWKAVVYMLSMNLTSFTIADTWEYVPANGSWQASALNVDASLFTIKHTMSVAIHSNTSQVLVGLPSMNIVFWFTMTTILALEALRDNGYRRGYGQSIGWSDEVGGPYPVLLGNSYSFPDIWSSSTIYWFTANEFRSKNPIMPLFPTIQYPRWIELAPKLLTIATASLHVALLDSSGQVYVIVSAPDGFYPDTRVALGHNPTFSIATPCPAGTYKDWHGIYICFLCPMGTMSVSEGSTACSPYHCMDEKDFCPLGSITNDTYADLNVFVSEVRSYPETPEMTNIDDILIMNMFTFGNSSRCLIISPLFWVMIMVFIATLIAILMGILKFFRQYEKLRHTLKVIFRQADLIREGELWMGGLASFALLILLIFSYVFSTAFLNQYPIENVTSSTFACDTTIRNAQFDTSLQSLSTAIPDREQVIFNLLDVQEFILTIDFINTKHRCHQVTVSKFIHNILKQISFNCTYNRSILSVSTSLASTAVSLNYDFTSAQTIGGFRVSLTGEEATVYDDVAKYHYHVRSVNFSQPFFKNNHTLGYSPKVPLSLTRIINKTQPLDDRSPYKYSAVWAPSTESTNPELFLNFEEYLYYGLLKTSFSISLSEISYYIMNSQKPITKQAELIFHNLLFTTVCMELFGLGYLAIKLFFLPIFHHFRNFVEKHSNIVHPLPASTPTEAVINTNIQKASAPEIFLAKPREKATQRPITKRKVVQTTKRRKP